MFLSWHSHRTSGRAATESDAEEMLVFPPQAIVQAIVFHLLDEKIVRVVSDESREQAVRKLSENGKSLAIPKLRWQTMENRQRLEWLVKHARMSVEGQIDGAAALHA